MPSTARRVFGVTAAGAVPLRPPAGADGYDYPLSLDGMNADTQRRQPLVNYEAIRPATSKAAGMPVVQGRLFSNADDATSPDVVIVSATLAQRFWPNESPQTGALRGQGDKVGDDASALSVCCVEMAQR